MLEPNLLTRWFDHMCSQEVLYGRLVAKIKYRGEALMCSNAAYRVAHPPMWHAAVGLESLNYWRSEYALWLLEKFKDLSHTSIETHAPHLQCLTLK